MINWVQVGQDFAQKYEGTFCRYLSPLTKQTEVFQVGRVTPNEDKGPDIRLFNQRAGELFLNYTTDAELDFTFPECGYFQHEKRALRFYRQYQRQWKKGICSSTATVTHPYNLGAPGTLLTSEILESAFKPREATTIANAIKTLKDDALSVRLNEHLALGLGRTKGEYFLWFDDELIGLCAGETIHLKVPQFRQEVVDYLRTTGDYARAIV